MSLFDPIKPYLSAIKLVGFCAVVIAAFSYGCSRGHASGVTDGNTAVAKILAERAQEKITAANQRADAAEAQAERYKARAESQAAIAEQFQEELNHAHDRADRTVADLHAGISRLQKQWRCPVPAPGQAAADPGQPDDGPGLQEASVGRIDRAVSACQAHVHALLKVAQDDRR